MIGYCIHGVSEQERCERCVSEWKYDTEQKPIRRSLSLSDFSEVGIHGAIEQGALKMQESGGSSRLAFEDLAVDGMRMRVFKPDGSLKSETTYGAARERGSFVHTRGGLTMHRDNWRKLFLATDGGGSMYMLQPVGALACMPTLASVLYSVAVTS